MWKWGPDTDFENVVRKNCVKMRHWQLAKCDKNEFSSQKIDKTDDFTKKMNFWGVQQIKENTSNWQTKDEFTRKCGFWSDQETDENTAIDKQIESRNYSSVDFWGAQEIVENAIKWQATNEFMKKCGFLRSPRAWWKYLSNWNLIISRKSWIFEPVRMRLVSQNFFLRKLF